MYSVADLDPGSGAFLTPGSGRGRKSASGSGIRDEQPGSYFPELRNNFFGFLGLKILKFFDADPGSGMETVRIRDPGWKKSDPESGINIPDPQHWLCSSQCCGSGSGIRNRFFPDPGSRRA